MRHAARGFTLIEVLVGMAILGVLLGVVMALQSSTLSISTSVSSSGRVSEGQNAAMNYIGDRFRSSSVTWAVPPSITLASGVTCDKGSAAKTCVAFAVPETDTTTGDVARCVLLAYRMEPRTGFTDRRPDGWADSNSVQIIREYRQVVTNTACPTSITPSGAFSSAVVGDGFTLTGAASTTITPFVLSGNQLTITLRSIYPRNGAPVYYPAAGSTTLRVNGRN